MNKLEKAVVIVSGVLVSSGGIALLLLVLIGVPLIYEYFTGFRNTGGTFLALVSGVLAGLLISIFFFKERVEDYKAEKQGVTDREVVESWNEVLGFHGKWYGLMTIAFAVNIVLFKAGQLLDIVQLEGELLIGAAVFTLIQGFSAAIAVSIASGFVNGMKWLLRREKEEGEDGT